MNGLLISYIMVMLVVMGLVFIAQCLVVGLANTVAVWGILALFLMGYAFVIHMLSG